MKDRLLLRTYCEVVHEFTELLKSRQLEPAACHKIGAEPDLITLIEANLGVGMLPDSAAKSDRIRLIQVDGLTSSAPSTFTAWPAASGRQQQAHSSS